MAVMEWEVLDTTGVEWEVLDGYGASWTVQRGPVEVVGGPGGGGLSAEEVRDLVASFITGSANITVTHDDDANTLTLTLGGGAGGALSDEYPSPGLNDEVVQDMVQAFIEAGDGVTVTYDDEAGTLTISAESPPAVVVVWRLLSQAQLAGLGATYTSGVSIVLGFNVAAGLRVLVDETGPNIYSYVADGTNTLLFEDIFDYSVDVAGDRLVPLVEVQVDQLNGDDGWSLYALFDDGPGAPELHALGGAALGGGGAVDSVNGETGVVVLDAADVGADPAGTAAGLVDDLSGVSDQSTARTNLGLGTAATADTGTGTSNVVLGNDSRLTDARTPNVGGSNDDFLQRKSGAWTNRTVAQVKADLGVTTNPWTVISEQTLGSNTTALSFTSLTHSEYRLTIEGNSSQTSTGNSTVVVRFNGDTASNYRWSRWLNFSGTNTDGAYSNSDTSIFLALLAASLTNTNRRSWLEARINGRAGGFRSVRTSWAHLNSNNDIAGPGLSGGWWQSTAAITSMSVFLSSGDFTAGSYVRLEGRS